MRDPLPIDAVLPAFCDALAGKTRLVLAAPPGAGKTTRAPLAILNEPWLEGRRILVLEPRRIAARMAAERLAAELSDRVGGFVGLSTRVDRRVSAATRIEVITDGLFTRRILADPELEGVGAVFFDEFHERSLNVDLGLAFALDAQGGLRPDLRLVVMSATLDTKRIAAAIDAPILESEGRAFPVETIYLGRSDERLEDFAARAVRRALKEQAGSILVFLPGMGEIQRTAERLGDLAADVVVAPLYGALSPAEQDRAVAPAPPGRRKVVLSTDLAESSLTIEGVSTVIDSGLARVADYDAASGGARLVTRRASLANVDQRRGRAGRLGPGVCYRLWDEEATRGLPREPTPEILSSNLAGLALALAEWGERDPMRLVFVDAPPKGRLGAAIEELVALGALDSAGAMTPKGRAIADLPLEPRLAAMIADAATPEARALAAEIAALISERGLGGSSTDIRDRVRRFRDDRSARAATLRGQAARWSDGAEPAPIDQAGRIIAAVSPSTIARARAGERGSYLTVSGRAARLDETDALAGAPWLAIADMTGAAQGLRILAAAPISEADALAIGKVETEDIAEFETAQRAIKARRVKRLGAIILAETALPSPPPEIIARTLADAVRAHGMGLLRHVGAIRQVQARLALAHAHFGDEWPALPDETLIARMDEWLSPLLEGARSLDDFSAEDLRRAVLSLLDWTQARKLDDIAPVALKTPAGRSIEIDYGAEGGPRAEARVQEFYGLDKHPAVAGGRARLTLSLLSPAQRQIAVTRDIVSFWTGGYRDMAKDMRSQYPKHDWPDDPARAKPHEGKTKARLNRNG